MYRQYWLSCDGTMRVGWLETVKPLKRGQRLTLKGDERVWTVEDAGGIELTQPPRHQQWRVGGLVGRTRLAAQDR